MLLLLFIITAVLTLFYYLFFSKSTESFEKIPCKKWIGDLKLSPPNICKDCGYPEDCHGPYVGDSWRHIFQTQSLE